MNKIQLINILKIRSFNVLQGKSIAQLIKDSGGEPTQKEMVKVNEMSMNYYIDEYIKEKEENNKLITTIQNLKNDLLFYQCLEEMGVDNWDGYGEAQELYEEYLKKE